MRVRLAKLMQQWLPLGAMVVMFILGEGFAGSLMAEKEQTYESLKLFSDVLQEIEENYVDEVDAEQLIQDAIKGMVDNLDPHSNFMPPEAFDELQDDTKGEFGGIGIVISMKKGVLTVVSPIEGTPAYKAGIMAGDVIVKIDDHDTAELALWECVKKMRGARGEIVVLTIVRKGETDPLIFSLERDIIPMTSVRSTTLRPGYGYIWVTNFRNNTARDMVEALTKLESAEVPLKGLIMDLRNNPGGLLNQAVAVSDTFLDQGVIVSIKGRQADHTEIFKARAGSVKRGYPMVVLINGGSASAAEIVAGALQDHKRAVILGTTSFGKGSVQTVKPMKDGFGLKYTIARYYTPSGRSIQAQGIHPDIEVSFHKIMDEPENGTENKEHKKFSMEHMLREKDLKNHLEPEMELLDKSGKKIKKETDHLAPADSIGFEGLKNDSQVRQALGILMGYSLLSRSEATR
ncbi:carboxyl-terminal processing protease [Desulfocicer vacuolatum DSM 3385]|uniref:Carboxyl-terminal processing protease n=1 Tax=Desulfocicer vacuolatum DSM 3385 TaxID=1121400 RepID=A0A1W1YNL4_9BACT|nr:S41 family peptidase [Desulfocicer vacuolatum]SMC37759.1 carboxyl-terminal processing protease [Desulfocicer vacuolatum DSM 3385]